jgi:hypothetical protein
MNSLHFFSVFPPQKRTSVFTVSPNRTRVRCGDTVLDPLSRRKPSQKYALGQGPPNDYEQLVWRLL